MLISNRITNSTYVFYLKYDFIFKKFIDHIFLVKLVGEKQLQSQYQLPPHLSNRNYYDSRKEASNRPVETPKSADVDQISNNMISYSICLFCLELLSYSICLFCQEPNPNDFGLRIRRGPKSWLQTKACLYAHVHLFRALIIAVELSDIPQLESQHHPCL